MNRNRRDERWSLHFIGTGNAFNTNGRGSSAFLLSDSERSWLIDSGPTIGAGIEAAGVDTTRIDRVVFTHLHGDHIAGWPFLLLRFLFLDRRTRPVEVIGPRGVRARLEGLAELCYGSVLSAPELPFDIDYRELAVERASGIDCGDGVVLDTIPVEHHESSIGLVFHLEAGATDTTVVGVSGDTAWCDGLEELVRRSDVVVIECTTVEPSEARHVSLTEIRARARLFADRRVFIVHSVDAVARAFDAQPIDGIVCATDGELVEL